MVGDMTVGLVLSQSIFVLCICIDYEDYETFGRPAGSTESGKGDLSRFLLHSPLQSLGAKSSTIALKAASVQKDSSPGKWFPGILQPGIVTGRSLYLIRT